MWYKKNLGVSIRSKCGDKRQVLSFGGKRCSFSKEGLRQLGNECLQKLDAGMSEADVQTWVHTCASEASRVES